MSKWKETLQPKIQQMSAELDRLRGLSFVREVHQYGFIARIEMERSQEAASVCIAAREHGLLTRPIRNMIVLMPPLCITSSQLSRAIEAIRNSIVDVCGQTKMKS